eukprot:gene10973-22929_t
MQPVHDANYNVLILQENGNSWVLQFQFTNRKSLSTVSQDTVSTASSASDTNKKSTAAEADDFLSKHGGKVAMVALSIAFGLIYRWIKSGQNRTNLETEIANASALEPIEVTEIRYANHLTLPEYKSIILACRAQFPSGYASYKDFIHLIKSNLNENNEIKFGYFYDRIISHYITTKILKNPTDNNSNHITNDTTSSTSISSQNEKSFDPSTNNNNTSHLIPYIENTLLPVDLLLVLLNSAVRQPSQDRVNGLYYVAVTSPKNSVTTSIGDIENNTVESDVEVHVEVSRDAIVQVVDNLMDTCQVKDGETAMKPPHTNLMVRWNSQYGCIFVDGSHMKHELELGDEVLFDGNAPVLRLFDQME